MNDRLRVLLTGAKLRAKHLCDLIDLIADGKVAAAAELQAECRNIPYEGSVWCLPCDQLLSVFLDPDGEGAA